MQILMDTTGSFEVWHAEQVRRPRAWVQMREDPQIFAIARRLMRDEDNRLTMTSMVEEALARCVPQDTVAERFAELVTYGQLVLRERPQDAYPLPDPYAITPMDLSALSDPQTLAAQAPPLAAAQAAPVAAAQAAPVAAAQAAPVAAAAGLPGPPTPAELGITGDTIPQKALRVELQEVIDFYEQPHIREDVRQRVWTDMRKNPNNIVVVRSIIGQSEVLPTPEELTGAGDLAGKVTGDAVDMLEALSKRLRSIRPRGR